MRRYFPVVALLGGAALAAASCRGAGSEPAGRVTVEPAAVRLAYPQSLPLKLDWQPARALDRQHGRPVAFVHLAVPSEKKNVVLRTFDHPLPKAWSAGQPQSYEIEIYQSALSEPVPPGRYVLSLGLYDGDWGYRWPLQTAGPEVAKREYQIATVEVAGPDPTAPGFEFAGAWQPLAKVPTKQVLDVRCFTAAASVAVQATAPGAVRLLVSTPAHGPSQVRVTSSCAPQWSETVGPETRKWIGAEIGAGHCEIRLEPAAPSSATSAGAPASACLEVLAWRPKAAPLAH
jgi:hypothetical protein